MMATFSRFLLSLLLLALLPRAYGGHCDDNNSGACDATRCSSTSTTHNKDVYYTTDCTQCGSYNYEYDCIKTRQVSCGKGKKCNQNYWAKCTTSACHSCWKEEYDYTSWDCWNNAGYDTSGNQCAAGKYSAAAGNCANCPAGKHENGARTGCNICGQGKYSSAGASSCSNCASGKKLSDNASHQNHHDNSNDCTNCPSGQVSGAGASGCGNCPAGKYTSDKIICNICSAGKYSSAGAASCTHCAEGKYISDGATHQNHHDSSNDCANCAAGKHANSDRSSCNTCDAGE